eukprot:3723274-Amphidinium_carterae.1
MDKLNNVSMNVFPGAVSEVCGALPVGGIFTLHELSKWDGVANPMCVGVCGKVWDVSSSPNFQPDHGYGLLW